MKIAKQVLVSLGILCWPRESKVQGNLLRKVLLTCYRWQYCLSDVRRAHIHWEGVWSWYWNTNTKYPPNISPPPTPNISHPKSAYELLWAQDIYSGFYGIPRSGRNFSRTFCGSRDLKRGCFHPLPPDAINLSRKIDAIMAIGGVRVKKFMLILFERSHWGEQTLFTECQN